MSVLTGQQERLRILWRLSWPAIIEQVLGTMVSYVDAAMVGVLGAVGSAAVSVNGPPIWLLNGILAGVGVGYSVQVSNAVGANAPQRVRKVIRQAFLAALICGLAACGLYEVLGGYLPRWLGAKPEVLPHAVHYIRIYCAAMPFNALLIVFAAVLRCMGNTKTPLLFNTAANLANMVLNFFLIYPTREWNGLTIPGAGWGVEGAAVATAASIVCAGVPAAIAAFRQGQYTTSLREGLQPDRMIIFRAVHLGFPSALERAVVNLGQIAMTGLVGHALTTAALAANNIATTAEGLCYLPAYGIGYAAIALVGQAVGAGSREDAKAYGDLTAILGSFLCLVTGTALFLFATPLASLFNSDAQVVAEAALALRVVAFAEPFFALSIILTSALRGADDVRFPMMVGLAGMWFIRVPLACLLVLRFSWGLAGVWFAMSMDLVLRGVLCALRWRKGKWVALSGLEG
ncbi:MATE family efflux transporter [Vermiculatibacterium agrestimuris]|uniref:MATE family efflux transporter n=1 Tax=Vermiculatibacterium agrestimuris TaxID=2941519 RepID=UPI002041F77F|nr:MATE family efflux transporter [Vermiculatibacterium agrestimuris]